MSHKTDSESDLKQAVVSEDVVAEKNPGLPRPYYQDEHVTLYHGDCRELLPLIEPADALVTDPPFGIGFKYETKESHSSAGPYYDWLMPLLNAAKLKDGALFAVWQAQLYFKYFWQYFGDDIHIYCAAKNFVQLRKTAINYGYDPVVMKYLSGDSLRPKKPKRNMDFFVSNTAGIISDTTRIEKAHPCPRPLDGVKQIVDNFVVENGLILDLFAGSGTTLLAAKQTKRKAIGVEIEEKYCEVAANRMRQEVLGL
jgi:site-specific DNA-methyltransferase (adenine-specific)